MSHELFKFCPDWQNFPKEFDYYLFANPFRSYQKIKIGSITDPSEKEIDFLKTCLEHLPITIFQDTCGTYTELRRDIFIYQTEKDKQHHYSTYIATEIWDKETKSWKLCDRDQSILQHHLEK